MTKEQWHKLLGLAFGCSLIVAVLSFFVFLFVADNASQALVYSGFTFLIAFIVLRWLFTRIALRHI